MKRLYLTLVILSILTISNAQDIPNANKFKLEQGLRFEENKGQVADADGNLRPDILFTMKDKGMNVYFTKRGISYQWYYTEEIPEAPYAISEATGKPISDEEDIIPEKLKEPKPTRIHTYLVNMTWVEASDEVTIISEQPYEDYTNYYHEHCPDGVLGVKRYAKVTYKNLYPNIDVVYYVTEGNRLKYDVLVHPGADLTELKFNYAGATPEMKSEKIRLNTPLGFLEEQEPVAWLMNDEKEKVDVAYSKNNKGLGFNYKAKANESIIIDPELVWGTYYGGSGQDRAFNTIVDPSGNVYLTGYSPSPTGIASGGHQNTTDGSSDAFLVKFNSAGVRQWGTYYGGAGTEQGASIAATNTEVYLSGYTGSSSAIATAGGHDATLSGNDAFLVKFDASGVRIWGTYYGGTGTEYGKVVILNGNYVYLAGYTGSSDAISSSGGVHQPALGGSNDAFLVQFTESGFRNFGTYYGGLDNDQAFSITSDPAGNIYLGGYTQSDNAISSGGHQNSRGGGADGFVAKFNSSGVRQWGTYYGGTDQDYISSVAADNSSNIYIAGSTTSSSSVAQSGFQNTFGGGSFVGDAFLVKMNGSGTRLWGTYYGSTAEDAAEYLATDPFGNIYMSGYTNGSSGLASGGFQNSFSGCCGNNDAFLVKFNPSGLRVWGTYFGNTGDERGQGIAVDGNQFVYLSGFSNSNSGIASGGHQNTNAGGSGDPFLVKFDGLLASAPSVQPTSISFSSIGIDAMQVSFNHPSPFPRGYLVVRKEGSLPTTEPVDGTSYSNGQVLGDGVVFDIGFTSSFSSSPLNSNAVYYYKIYSYNGIETGINYLQSAPLTGSQTTLATEPLAQPTILTSSNTTINSMDVGFTPAAGVDGYLVIRREGATPSGTPLDGNAYIVGTTLGDGTVVFVGSGTSFSQTGLTPNTNYFYSVYSYRGAGAASNYLITSPLSSSRSTLVTEPASAAISLTFPTFTVNSLVGSFIATTADGYIVLQRASASPTGTPIDGTTYTLGTTLGDGTVVALGTGTTFTASSLTANTVYHYDVIAYNGSGNIINYNTTARLEGSRITLQTEPTAQPTAITFNNITIASLGSSFTAATGSPEGYIVFRRQGSAPTFTPVDGTTYSSGAQGDAVVVSSSAGTTFTDAGLVAGTVYHYAVYAFNGAGQAINYRTSSPLANSVITISAAPSATTATLPTQTSFTANWSAVTGAASYSLDVSQDNFSNLLPTYSGKSVGGLSDAVTGLTPGTSYQYRVRAVNASGSSANSNTISQLTFPSTPSASAATSLTSSSFIANWSSVVSATGYFLDVATDAAFTSFQVGYNNLSVTNTFQSVTGLSSGVTFYYRVRSVNASGTSTSSNVIETATITAEPIAQPTAISFSNPTTSSYTVSFASAVGSPAGYIAFTREGAAPIEVPQDGTTYSVGATIGSSRVAYIGSATSFTVSGLNPNTINHVALFSYNGSALTTNYLTSSALTGSGTTLQTEPTSQPTILTITNATANSLDVSYSPAAGVDGYLVVRRLGAAPTGTPVDGVFYSVGNTLVDGTVVFVGAGTSFSQTGLIANTVYHYAVYSYRGAGAATNYLITSPLRGNRSTLSSEPASAPTVLTFPTFTTTSLGGSFTATIADGYLILQRATSSPTGTPVDGTTYTVGNTIGDGTVVAVGAGNIFTASSLTTNTVYHYDVIAYNGSGNIINYNTASRLEGSRTTLQTEPAGQPTALSFSNVTINSQDASFTAVGGVDGYVVLRRSGSAPTFVPVDGTIYTAATTQGDAQVISVGSAVSFNNTILTANTVYHYAVYSYRGTGAATNYLTTSPLSGNRSTLASEPASAPTALTFSTFTTTSLGGSFTVTTADGYLVLQRATDSPTGTPIDGTSYTVGNTIGDGTVVALGTGTTFTASSLTANTLYHYDVIAYNGSGNIINYNTISRLEGSRTTLQTEPTAQPTAITFNNITIASLGSSFTAATGSPEGYIVLRRQGSAPTFTPVDGTTYSPGAQGDAVVVSASDGTTFTDAGLVAGTVYHYAVYAFNGAGQAINYRTSGPLANSVITISAAPSATTATLPTQTSFTANWSAVTGAASYSLDVSQDNFSNLLPTYSGKSVSGLSDAVTGLTPGTSYQYRVRAVNASGLSDNSNTIIQKTIPQTPTALQPQPTAIRSNDFTAVWSASPGADNYELDVSQNNFVTFITGFQSKSIPAGVTEEIVTGLSPTTPYQYRVRARNTAGPSTSSNEITVTTTAVGGTAPLAISGTQAPQGILSSSGPLAVTTTVSGGSGTKAVKLFYRGIVANNFIELNMGNPQGNNTYEVNIPAAAADQLGVEFYIRAQAGAEVIQTNRNFIYKTFSASEATAIPSITLSGGTLETYQIISIPLQLEDNLISSVFEPALGAYDKTKWRLVRFQNGRNTDYQAGLTRINQGESYWFNSVDPVSVKPGEATTPRYNQSNPFVLKLAQGWNQIATPYPFSINWDDVLDDPSNNNPSGIGKYRVYVPESASFADSNTLQPYSGGFVFADPARDLILPVTLNNPSGGRKATNTISSDLGNEEWMVPITLSQGKAFNMFGAVGMHPQASPGKDDFDDITLPRFIKHLEFNSYHEEFIVPRFSKDIVPTSNKHVWDIAIESNFDEGPITLSWEGIDFGSSESQLILFDQAAGVLIDMKKNSSYQLHNSTRHDIQFIYHRDKKIDVSNTLLLGKPFPNPSAGEVTFNLFSATPINGQLEIVDMMGKKMITTGFSLDGEYVKTLRWSGAMPNEMPVAAGVYIYQIVTSSKTIQGRIIIK